MGATVSRSQQYADHTHSAPGDGGNVIDADLVTAHTTLSAGVSGSTNGVVRFWDASTAFRHSLGIPVAGLSANRAIELPDLNGAIFVAGNANDPATLAGTMSRVNRVGQTGNVGSGTILCKTCPAGLYMVNVYMECSSAGAAGSTVVLTLSYTDSVGAKTYTLTLVSDAVQNKQNQTFPVYINAAGDITWKTVRTGGTYAVRMRPAYMGA